VINFDNVTKVYPNQSRPALESVNLSVAKGEFVFLVGPSGSGKSTLLRLVLKEERPSEGRIHVAGRDLARLTNWKVPYLRRRIGCVFQDFRLLPNKSVYQNVAFALEVIGKNRRFIRKVVPRSSTWSAWRASMTACPTNCPAGSSSGSRWPGPSSTGR
jgi:cell division transport system ATP-binding protein